MSESPFLIGIDLGTTNSAVAYVERRRHARDALDVTPRVFEIPQLVAPGDVQAQSALPSFVYLAEDHERASGLLDVPWQAGTDPVGAYARDQGALVPSRQVASAKSWLAYGGVDRTAPILPAGRDAGARGISPVEASARYLAHVREAWNATRAKGQDAARFERQQAVLTVPASFDEEARELTVAAARQAGLEHLTLLEEPLAALYAWLSRHRRTFGEHVRDGSTVLVCDVGGGTTDFSLVRVTLEDGGLSLERVAIGEHLLLGGDNLDIALAAGVEQRLGTRLTLTQRLALRRQCTSAKERLLSDLALESVPVTILGSGRAVVGGSVTAAVSRDDVGALLEEGFLPLVGPGDRPRREQRPGGLRELGLPYESDPAITRHLALFLARAAQAGGEPGGGAVRPDAVLFNGGFFAPALARERMVEALTAWGGAAPWVLPVERPEAAVALGAAYYAHLREQPDAMRRLLIKAGSARTYYLGLQEAGGRTGQTAITVLARGVQEGTTAELPERVFSALTNRPVAFPLYSSLVRADPAGEIVQLDPASEDLHRHAPLVTVLRFGKRSRSVEIPVHLSARFTELGTLELWLQSRDTDHRWRLQFQLRGSQQRDEDEAEETTAARDEAVVSEQAVAEGERLVHGVFAETPPGGDEANPETLVARLETAFGFGKGAWPLAALRRLADRLLAAADGRRRSPRHEARWLNLTGFCLRPGFGAAADAWRVGEARKVYAAGLAFPRDVQCQVEWLILWQRVAGGFSAGQQRELAQRTMASLGIGARKPPRLNPQIERESWRLLASLERLDRDLRVRIGNELAARVRKEPRDASLLWSLGRLGARRPFYGPLDRSVPPETAEGWLEALLRLPALVPEAAGAVAQIAARTDDAALDVSDATRERAAAALDEAGASRDLIDAVRHARERSDEDAVRYFGERLPEGLRSLTIDD